MGRERGDSIINGDNSYNTDGSYSKSHNNDSVFEKESDQGLPDSSPRGDGFIEHPVSRFDTLAGVAIKYGVEVADIRKMNGLVTDHQMFALKSIQIPLPGRHLPSPCLSNGFQMPGQSSANRSPARDLPPDLLDSFQSLRPKTTPPRVSLAMTSLQGFYGLKQTKINTISDAFEMAVYRKVEVNCVGDGPFMKPSSACNLPLKLRRNCRSEANGFFNDNDKLRAYIMSPGEAKEGEHDKSKDKQLRRRPKSEADFFAHRPAKVFDDNTSGRGFSTIASKGLALRSKTGSRSNLLVDNEMEFSPTTTGVGDGYVIHELSAVKRSTSTPCLQDPDSCTGLSSIWPASKWSLKPDLQVLSTTSIFDGLSNPVSGHKNKAALD
ncbi:Detected protein of confused Function [Hibiscus syriacus]|uniref:Detected protein of confused Function n=1 Tax=Hibiscus syriacus TaxID=106335 RepID=A0A6A2X4I3_HIBSY|nr:uncharacterized protein LOC120176011 [Hibiscus syriacus]KAE8669698.1 Detected protein of confused Function [Hibiscus syriacus]